MLNKLDDAKADLLDRAAEAPGALDDVEDAAFLHRYYRRVAPEDLLGRDPRRRRRSGVLPPRARRQPPAGNGPSPRLHARRWTSTAGPAGHTRRRGRHRRHAVPRRLGHRRARPGRARDPPRRPPAVRRARATSPATSRGPRRHGRRHRPPETPPSSRGCTSRSTGSPTRRGLAPIEAALRRVLSRRARGRRGLGQDARRRLRVAETLDRAPAAGVPAEEVAEARELLRWLADDHFTFLGYREYDLEPRSTARTCCVAVARHRARHPARRPAMLERPSARCPPEVRAKAREPQLLVLTKANSPLDRPPPGLPRLRRRQDVRRARARSIGERRFLGLFTSAAYNESMLRVPVLRRKVREVLDASGFAPDSHYGKDLLQILETYPRDELFQISADELLPIALAVLHLQERRQTRLFLRRDVYGRFMSCLVYLPRDRYTTAGAPGDGGDPARGVRRREHRLHRSGLRVGAGPAALRRAGRPGRAVPDVDPADARGAAGRGDARSWADDFADALRRPVRRGAGVDPAAALRRRVPRGLQGGLPGAHGGRRPAPARGAAAATATMALNLYTPPGAGPGERRFKLFQPRARRSRCRRCCRVLQRMGVEVVDERPYEIERHGRPAAWVYDFGLRYDAGRRRRSASATSTARACSRTRSPRSGRARPRATGSTPWCCGPG